MSLVLVLHCQGLGSDFFFDHPGLARGFAPPAKARLSGGEIIGEHLSVLLPMFSRQLTCVKAGLRQKRPNPLGPIHSATI